LPIEIFFKNKIIIINDDSGADIIDDNVTSYWQEKPQLIKNDENIFLDLDEWLNDQHLTIVMQMLYIQNLQSLGYQQQNHTNHT
jgi:hypothetical protein